MIRKKGLMIKGIELFSAVPKEENKLCQCCRERQWHHDIGSQQICLQVNSFSNLWDFHGTLLYEWDSAPLYILPFLGRILVHSFNRTTLVYTQPVCLHYCGHLNLPLLNICGVLYSHRVKNIALNPMAVCIYCTKIYSWNSFPLILLVSAAIFYLQNQTSALITVQVLWK